MARGSSVFTFAMILAFAGSRSAPAQEDPAPGFTLSVEPAQLVVAGAPGSIFRRELEVRLTTTDNPSETDGAQGWSLGVVAEGAAVVVDISTNRDCSPFPPLCQAGLVRNFVGSNGTDACQGKTAAVSIVVLHQTERVTLPPEGTVTVAWITVEGRIPPTPGETAGVRIHFLNGCRGAGGPINSVITWMGRSVTPTLREGAIEVRASERTFRRGDTNGDGAVDISDAVFVLGCKFLGGLCPSCRDAADANDDGEVDVSDPVSMISFLFLGSLTPAAPGPWACGPDPTGDALPDCIDETCAGGTSPLQDFTFLEVNPQGFVEYVHDPTGMVFVSLKGGKFLMGTPEGECSRQPEEGPVHDVTLSSFLIGKYEVTQAQWRAVMGTNPSEFQDGAETDGHPVESIRGDQNFFQARTGLSLPTEAQWEYACRAGTRTAYHLGDTLSTRQANFGSTFNGSCPRIGPAWARTLPVDSFEPNGFGLYNMHGNVAERCRDGLDPDFYSRPEAAGYDPLNPSQTYPAVIRGGNWAVSQDFCRSGTRNAAYNPNGVGLRMVWNPSGSSP